MRANASKTLKQEGPKVTSKSDKAKTIMTRSAMEFRGDPPLVSVSEAQ